MRNTARPWIPRLILALGPLTAAAVWAAATPPTPSPATTPKVSGIKRSLDLPEGVLVAPGKEPDAVLLYTGDVIGYLEPCG